MLLSNKELVLHFYKTVIGGRNEAALAQFISTDYKQHNPTLKDGIAGIQEAILQLKAMPQPPAQQTSPVRMILEDGAFIVLLCRMDTGNKVLWVLDLFRITDGLITEHWDAVQETDPETILPLPCSSILTKRIFSEQNTVVSQSIYSDAEKQYAVYDIYERQDTVVMRHQRIVQQIPQQMPHNNGMI